MNRQRFWTAFTIVMVNCGVFLAVVGDTLFLAAFIMAVVGLVKLVDA